MLFPGRDHEPHTYHLVAPRTRDERTERQTFPVVVRGRNLLHHFQEGAFEGEAVQPCSLDTRIEQFTDIAGKPLKFPFTIPQHGTVIGYTNLEYKGPDVIKKHEYMSLNTTLCVETRSRAAARLGFACLGFYDKRKTKAFLHGPLTLAFTFINYAPVSVIIERPFSPVQLWGIKDKEAKDYTPQNGVQLVKDGADVTAENRYALGELHGYKVHCGGKVSFFPATGTAIPLGELEHHLQEGTIDDISEAGPGFYLTITAEEVRTNGCPVYMPPFHFKDIDEKLSWLIRRNSWEALFEEAFTKGTLMPITTNAGLHNPGCTGKIIFENVTEGRKGLGEYFEKGKPFGLIIPIPFEDGGTDHSYESVKHLDGIRVR